MSSKMKKILWIIGIIVVVLVVVIGVGYLTLVPKPLKPPQAVREPRRARERAARGPRRGVRGTVRGRGAVAMDQVYG